MNKTSIALYIQHYLAPSMTFVYRQLKSAEKIYNPIVLCSDWLENRDRFPFENLYFKQRNFVKFKKNRIIGKLVGWHSIFLSNPILSKQQKQYFLETIKTHKVRLIHAHFGPAGLEILDLAKELRIPLIVTFHGYDASVLLTINKYIKNLQKLFNYANLITVSNSMKNDLIRFGANEKSINVIRCGIPINKFSYVEREPLNKKFSENKQITFLQVSNFVEVKGHKYSVMAYKNFSKKYKNSKLILAGDGQTRKQIQKLCKQLEISDKVEFPGVVTENQVIELMKDSDVFLQHSVNLETGVKEGLPTVLMEAMSTGLPVISTYHSAIPELITHGVDGFLVEERNITEYTKTLFDLKNCSSEIGLRASEKVSKNFNLLTETKKLFDLYESVM